MWREDLGVSNHRQLDCLCLLKEIHSIKIQFKIIFERCVCFCKVTTGKCAITIDVPCYRGCLKQINANIFQRKVKCWLIVVFDTNNLYTLAKRCHFESTEWYSINFETMRNTAYVWSIILPIYFQGSIYYQRLITFRALISNHCRYSMWLWLLIHFPATTTV